MMTIRRFLFLGLLAMMFAFAPRVDHASSQQITAVSTAKPMLVAEFDSGEIATNSGVKWQEATDKSAGGTSTVRMELLAEGAENSKGALRITGNVTTDFPYGGFAGISVVLHADNKPEDLSGYTGVTFYARGDEARYRVAVSCAAVKDHNDFGKVFTTSKTWTRIRVPFAELTQMPGWGQQVMWTAKDVRGLVFTTVGAPRDNYRLDIDQISFY